MPLAVRTSLFAVLAFATLCLHSDAKGAYGASRGGSYRAYSTSRLSRGGRYYVTPYYYGMGFYGPHYYYYPFYTHGWYTHGCYSCSDGQYIPAAPPVENAEFNALLADVFCDRMLNYSGIHGRLNASVAVAEAALFGNASSPPRRLSIVSQRRCVSQKATDPTSPLNVPIPPSLIMPDYFTATFEAGRSAVRDSGVYSTAIASPSFRVSYQPPSAAYNATAATIADALSLGFQIDAIRLRFVASNFSSNDMVPFTNDHVVLNLTEAEWIDSKWPIGLELLTTAALFLQRTANLTVVSSTGVVDNVLVHLAVSMTTDFLDLHELRAYRPSAMKVDVYVSLPTSWHNASSASSVAMDLDGILYGPKSLISNVAVENYVHTVTGARDNNLFAAETVARISDPVRQFSVRAGTVLASANALPSQVYMTLPRGGARGPSGYATLGPQLSYDSDHPSGSAVIARRPLSIFVSVPARHLSDSYFDARLQPNLIWNQTAWPVPRNSVRYSFDLGVIDPSEAVQTESPATASTARFVFTPPSVELKLLFVVVFVHWFCFGATSSRQDLRVGWFSS